MTENKRDIETGVSSGSVGSNDRANHDEQGRFARGNTASLVHGGRSKVLRRELEDEAAEALAERREAIAADLGGVTDLSTLALDTVRRYVSAAAMLEWMEGRLLAEGVLTGKGRRKALHNAYLAQLDRVVRLAGLLGLERKAKGVTLAQHVQQKSQEATQ